MGREKLFLIRKIKKKLIYIDYNFEIQKIEESVYIYKSNC